MAKPDLRALLRAELARAGDPKKTAAMQAYMKSAMPYWGVQTAELRAICRPSGPGYVVTQMSHWPTSGVTK